ncbi:MAG: S8 family serine peptidase [Actinobacteria bacterium]|nr:S8 family serine peptidase [Actinomycetota bacterium]
MAEPHEEELPAWSLPANALESIRMPPTWPDRVDRDWAWGGSTGKGAVVAVVDSGIELGHPLVGEVEEAVVVTGARGEEPSIDEDEQGDACGHGTACAGIIRSLAPECRLVSVRVLGSGWTGSGRLLVAGLRWAIDRGVDVINMSLSTTKLDLAATLHELTDAAYFNRTIVVASAHNMPVESFPWRFSSVLSVGSHELEQGDTFFYNPNPPVEFFARGVEVEVAWLGGSSLRSTGNSFATPHMSGLCALIRAKHPELTPFQVKNVLYLTANNVLEETHG